MIAVSVPLRRELEVAWDVEQAYGLVADVPLSAGHFPGLKGLDDLGDGAWRWRLDEFEVGRFKIDAGYAARYTCDPVARTVRWTTVEPAGNVRADGSWTVTPRGSGARLVFENKLQVSLELPRLAQGLVGKIVPAVYQRQTATYLERIAQRMGGRLLG